MESKVQVQHRGALATIFKRAYQIPCRIICVSVLLLQSCLLDYYLVFYNNYIWCLWGIADVLVSAVFLASLIISYRLLSDRAANEDSVKLEGGHVTNVEQPKTSGGELPLGYIAWLLYSLVLCAKIGVIFGNSLYLVQRITSESQLDGSVLRTALSLSSIVFFTLVITHHDAPTKSERQAFMESLSSSVSIDLLDATQFLDVLYIYDSHIILSYGLHTSVVVISCTVFILPTLLLLALSRSRFGRSDHWLKRLRFCHRVLYFLSINIPMLVIRTTIWHVHKKEASVFVMKNVMGIGIAVNEIYTKMTEVVRTSSNASSVQLEMVPMRHTEEKAAFVSVKPSVEDATVSL